MIAASAGLARPVAGVKARRARHLMTRGAARGRLQAHSLRNWSRGRLQPSIASRASSCAWSGIRCAQTPPLSAPPSGATPAQPGAPGSSITLLHASSSTASASAPTELVLAAGAATPLPDLSTVKGILLDIDGTLTNSDPLHLLA
jgi:hypothetical protein